LVDVESGLVGLALTLTGGLGCTGHEVLVALTGESLALWELLAGTLVGLASLKRTVVQGSLLLELLGEVLLVRLGLVLWLGGKLLGRSTVLVDWGVVGDDALLLLGASIGKTLLLSLELSIASLWAPTLGSLLLVLTEKLSVFAGQLRHTKENVPKTGAAVTVVTSGSGTTAHATGTVTTATTSTTVSSVAVLIWTCKGLVSI